MLADELRVAAGELVRLRPYHFALRTLHRWKWYDIRRAFTTPQGRWKPITADGIELFDLQTVPVTRYRYRGSTIPSPWAPDHA